MNPDVKAQWLEALRSGKYVKGEGKLKLSDTCYCALGVLALLCPLKSKTFLSGGDLFGADRDICNGFFDKEVSKWCGLDHSQQVAVSRVNDQQADTFEEVADWIEKEL